MRITSKGQVTIPQEIREKAGLLPGTEVEFVLDGGMVHVRKVEQPLKPGRGAQIVARLRSAGKLSMSTDEIMALMRGER